MIECAICHHHQGMHDAKGCHHALAVDAPGDCHCPGFLDPRQPAGPEIPAGVPHIHVLDGEALARLIKEAKARRPKWWQSSRVWIMVILGVSMFNSAMCAWGAANVSIPFYLYFMATEAAACWAITELWRK